MRTLWSLPVVAAVVLSLGLASGCSGTDDSASALLDSPDSLTQEEFVSTLAGAMGEAGSAQINLTASVLGQELDVEGVQSIGETAADSRLAVTTNVLGMAVDLRVVDQVVYANLGALSQNMFATVDLTDTSDPLVGQVAGLAEQADVVALLEGFDDAITGFEQAGDSQEIDGVDTAPYVLTIDGSQLPQAEGAPASPGTFEVTIFVGSDALPRRVVSAALGQPVTLDLSKWGEPVEVAAPPADQISDQDLAQILDGLSALTGG